MARCCLLLGLGAWTCVAAKALPLASAANAQVQLRCDDPLLETRGAAQLKRSTSQLSVSLGRDARPATPRARLACCYRDWPPCVQP
jgi:hypothetical protein